MSLLISTLTSGLIIYIIFLFPVKPYDIRDDDTCLVGSLQLSCYIEKSLKIYRVPTWM